MPSGPVSQTNDTTLELTYLGASLIPRWATRAMTENLELIEAAAQITRSINGNAMNWSQTQFHKYKLTLSCLDQRALAFDGLPVGAEVQVDCVTELSYRTSGGSPSRTVVTSSSRVEGDFTFYRPRLTMVFMGRFPITTPEWEGRTGFQAEFEEV